MTLEINNSVMLKQYKTITINGKQERLHRYLMEQKLGRKLEFNEIVHHIDGNKFNNNIDNLELISRSDHMSMHKEVKELSLAVQTKYFIDYSTVIDLYAKQGKSSSEVSDILGVPKATIKWFIAKHGIKHMITMCLICGEKARYIKAKLCDRCYHQQYYKQSKERAV